MLFVNALVFLGGLAVVGTTLVSALRAFVLPRAAPDRFARAVFLAARFAFDRRVERQADYHARDRIMAFYAPTSLLLLLVAWLFAVLVGFMLMFWLQGHRPWNAAFTLSASSLLALGFAVAPGLLMTVMALLEATLGLILVALLIGYLPTMYTSLSPLVFFRSPHADNSWVTAAGVVLDAASLSAAVLDAPREPQAELGIRAGYLALRYIADFFQ